MTTGFKIIWLSSVVTYAPYHEKIYFDAYRFYPNYSQTWPPYCICPKTWASLFYYLLKMVKILLDKWQIVFGQIRRRVLRRLIWTYTVCSGLSVQTRRRIWVYTVWLGSSVQIYRINTACEQWRSKSASKADKSNQCIIQYQSFNMWTAKAWSECTAYFYIALLTCIPFHFRVDPGLWCTIWACTVYSGLYLRLWFFVTKIGNVSLYPMSLPNAISLYLKLCRDQNCKNVKNGRKSWAVWELLIKCWTDNI